MSSLWIIAGQVALANGSNAVSGNGTAFQANGVQAGWIFTPDFKTIYQVQAVADDGHLTIWPPYSGTTTPAGTYQSYAIIPNLSPLGATLLASVQQLVTMYNQFPGGNPVQIVTGPPTAAAPSGSFAFNTTASTLYLYQNNNWTLIGGGGSGGGGGASLSTGAGAPSGLVGEGAFYYDTAGKTLYLQHNNVWIQVSASGGGSLSSLDGAIVMVDTVLKALTANGLTLENVGTQPGITALGNFIVRFGQSTAATFALNLSDGATDHPVLWGDVTGPYANQIREKSVTQSPLIGNVVFDHSSFTVLKGTVQAGATLNFSAQNAISGFTNRGLLIVSNLGAAGSVSWGSTNQQFLWEGGSAPTFSTNGTDMISFITVDGQTYYASLVGRGFA